MISIDHPGFVTVIDCAAPEARQPYLTQAIPSRPDAQRSRARGTVPSPVSRVYLEAPGILHEAGHPALAE